MKREIVINKTQWVRFFKDHPYASEVRYIIRIVSANAIQIERKILKEADVDVKNNLFNCNVLRKKRIERHWIGFTRIFGFDQEKLAKKLEVEWRRINKNGFTLEIDDKYDQFETYPFVPINKNLKKYRRPRRSL